MVEGDTPLILARGIGSRERLKSLSRSIYRSAAPPVHSLLKDLMLKRGGDASLSEANVDGVAGRHSRLQEVHPVPLVTRSYRNGY